MTSRYDQDLGPFAFAQEEDLLYRYDDFDRLVQHYRRSGGAWRRTLREMFPGLDGQAIVFSVLRAPERRA
jgi:hypothetical protein